MHITDGIEMDQEPTPVTTISVIMVNGSIHNPKLISSFPKISLK
jgi:hypothetical protein